MILLASQLKALEMPDHPVRTVLWSFYDRQSFCKRFLDYLASTPFARMQTQSPFVDNVKGDVDIAIFSSQPSYRSWMSLVLATSRGKIQSLMLMTKY